MFDNISITIQKVGQIFIPKERQEVLQLLVNYIQNKKDNQQEIRLNFICTHNSRRSHLSQIWAQTMAHHFNINRVYCYSGGTEATAMFPKVAETLIRQGFDVLKLNDNLNPVYILKFNANQHPIIGFSKTYFDNFNPKNNFAAIMTCNNADEGCPLVLGADARIPIKYDDPKICDNTEQMDEKYAERSLQIASEMYFVFSNLQ